MTLIEQIKKDVEVGTPGDWELEKPNGTWGRIPGTEHGYIFMSCIIDGYPNADEANARRIARVPQMETALLAAEELAGAVESWENAAVDHMEFQDKLFAALSAYRSATETDNG